MVNALVFIRVALAKTMRALSLSLICSKFYQLFLLALPKRFTQYSYFILTSLPVIPILLFMLYCLGIDIHRNVNLIHTYFVVAIV